MKKYLLLLCILILGSCTEKTYKMVYPTLSDNKYDSEFPYKNCSTELNEISGSVKKLICLTKYKTMFFDFVSKLTNRDIVNNRYKNYIIETYKSTKTVSGTATVMYSDTERILFLSCAHVVDNPDTLIRYYEDEVNNIKFIKSISIKMKQQNYIKDVPENGLLKIIAMDSEEDIVFLEKTYLKTQEKLNAINYPIGNSNELEWGSFVYIIGFPTGVKMITRGIVSKSENKKSKKFYIDAVVNWGYSGGIVLAVRDGVPNFEIVGIARAASVRYENILTPAKDTHEFIYNKNEPYEDNIYVYVKKNINYGVTYAVPIETIKKFYQKNKKTFLEKNYNLNYFLK